MENQKISEQLQDIQQKLELIGHQMKDYQRRQMEIDEFKKDMSLIGKDIFNAAVEELEDVAPYFDTNDLLHLFKKLLRNTRNLNALLSQLEGAVDLYKDLQPLGKQMFDEILETLHEFDQKGYFEFLKESVQIVDTIVTTFSVEDVRHLRENITTILLTIKGMTQPDMLGTINNALGFFKKMDIEVKEDITVMKLVRQMSDPEVKKGLYFMLEFVKNMSQNQNISTAKTE